MSFIVQAVQLTSILKLGCDELPRGSGNASVQMAGGTLKENEENRFGAHCSILQNFVSCPARRELLPKFAETTCD